MKAAPPGHGLGPIIVPAGIILLAESIPGAAGLPAAEGVSVDRATLTKQDEQLGVVVVVDDQSPGAHGAAVDRVTQGGHVGGGDGGGDGGGGHGVSFG